MTPDTELRRAAFSTAYRIVGLVADAEDIAQEALLKWYRVEASDIHSPAAYVARIAANLCLDHLRRDRVERAAGRDWLPEPIVDHPYENDPPVDFTYAMLVALQSLTPLERAVFLLRTSFDCSYDEIGQTLSRSAAACRQAHTRARRVLRDGRPDRTSPGGDRDLCDLLMRAIVDQDLEGLRTLLAADVVVRADGRSNGPALKRPLVGRDVGARFLIASRSLLPDEVVPMFRVVSGQHAIVVRRGEAAILAIMIAPRGTQIGAVFAIADPAKIARL
ncbi:MAG: sigma-70 family RNA polymerase sigma factor [Alphaproteobacteria bacterium]|nr:sigma-70 family RNA polymerase sigma factor [Alphaproteobacteria bacterium]